MRFEDLGDKEYLLLGVRAEKRCSRVLAKATRPDLQNHDVQVLKQQVMSNHERAQALTEVDQQTGWPLVWHIDEKAIERLLVGQLPALFTPFECVPPDFRAALIRIEKELTRFYGILATFAGDSECRALFFELAGGAPSRMRREASSSGSLSRPNLTL